eukprot:m51a1_g969 hypothetical protein (90) ;mRNA; r:377835-379214
MLAAQMAQLEQMRQENMARVLLFRQLIHLTSLAARAQPPETVYAALWLRDPHSAAVLDDTLVAETVGRMEAECMGEGDVVLANVTRSAS